MTSFSIPSALPAQIQAGYGASLGDTAAFDRALEHAHAGGMAFLQSPAAATPSPAMQTLFSPLTQIDAAASQISTYAHDSVESGLPMSPGEALAFTAHVQEFGLMTQLTATAANRLSDGVQQVLRQQA